MCMCVCVSSIPKQSQLDWTIFSSSILQCHLNPSPVSPPAPPCLPLSLSLSPLLSLLGSSVGED